VLGISSAAVGDFLPPTPPTILAEDPDTEKMRDAQCPSVSSVQIEGADPVAACRDVRPAALLSSTHLSMGPARSDQARLGLSIKKRVAEYGATLGRTGVDDLKHLIRQGG